jgi:crossover junction endodeoxyribonuclease RuvC
MRVLGIDCGAERTGYGVIDTDGSRHVLVAAGTIRTKPRDAMAVRLNEIALGLRRMVVEHSPNAVAVEEVFHAVNTQSAIKLAQVRGVALLVAAEAGLPVGEYSALAIKKCVVGHGHATKEQVQFMTRSILGPAAPVNLPDACDALAVAVCYATHEILLRRLPA